MASNKLFQYFRLGTKLLCSKFSKRSWPISVSYHVTRFCNLRCKHCYAVLDAETQPDPTLDQMLDVIDGLAKRGTLSIRLLGGEPLMRNDLPQIIDRVKANGMFCEVVTNGMLLRKRIKEWPEMKKVDSVCVSLDGDKVVHETLRGAGSFDGAMDGIHALLEADISARLHASLAAESYKKGYAPHKFLAELSQKHNIPFNIATYCPNPYKGSADEANQESFKMSKEVYGDLLEMKKQGVLVTTTTHILERGVDWFNHTDQYVLFGGKTIIPPGHRKCQAGITNCFINADGGMYSCIPRWKDGLSVYTDGLDKAYEYMVESREKARCQICYNLAQWEYSSFFTFSDPKLLLNMARNILRLARKSPKSKG